MKHFYIFLHFSFSLFFPMHYCEIHSLSPLYIPLISNSSQSQCKKILFLSNQRTACITSCTQEGVNFCVWVHFVYSFLHLSFAMLILERSTAWQKKSCPFCNNNRADGHDEVRLKLMCVSHFFYTFFIVFFIIKE